MVEADDRVSFPVVFCDGECESNIGVVVVYPTLEFKRFQSELSRMIGISPHQFSVYLSSRESRRRIPITGKQPIKKNPPDNVMLLRRGTGISPDPAFSGFMVPYADRVEYEKRVRELELEREKYIMNMGVKVMSLANNTGAVREKVGKTLCNLCLGAKEMGREVEFHHCVCDAVTFDFRSPAGPIGRPVKGSEYT